MKFLLGSLSLSRKISKTRFYLLSCFVGVASCAWIANLACFLGQEYVSFLVLLYESKSKQLRLFCFVTGDAYTPPTQFTEFKVAFLKTVLLVVFVWTLTISAILASLRLIKNYITAINHQFSTRVMMLHAALFLVSYVIFLANTLTIYGVFLEASKPKPSVTAFFRLLTAVAICHSLVSLANNAQRIVIYYFFWKSAEERATHNAHMETHQERTPISLRSGSTQQP